MVSLRCMRQVGCLALLAVLAACSNGRGSVDEAQPPPAQGAEDSFAVGGNVSGLVGSGLVLQNNGGGDLPVAEFPGGRDPGRDCGGARFVDARSTRPDR